MLLYVTERFYLCIFFFYRNITILIWGKAPIFNGHYVARFVFIFFYLAITNMSTDM